MFNTICVLFVLQKSNFPKKSSGQILYLNLVVKYAFPLSTTRVTGITDGQCFTEHKDFLNWNFIHKSLSLHRGSRNIVPKNLAYHKPHQWLSADYRSPLLMPWRYCSHDISHRCVMCKISPWFHWTSPICIFSVKAINTFHLWDLEVDRSNSEKQGYILIQTGLSSLVRFYNLQITFIQPWNS